MIFKWNFRAIVVLGSLECHLHVAAAFFGDLPYASEFRFCPSPFRILACRHVHFLDVFRDTTLVIKHDWLENPLQMEVLRKISSVNEPFSSQV